MYNYKTLAVKKTTMKLTQEEVSHFQEKVLTYFADFGRSFPWRENTNPYFILVSEMMLQQTQTDRVVPKFLAFIEKFPDFTSLAQGAQAEVLTLWSGLGYNRRALFLKKCAETVWGKFKGKLPESEETLRTLPGIGPYTAGALRAFAFNQPTVLIETNVRTVFIHEFFQDKENISDQEILPLIEQTLIDNPREWYWALMDYGVMIKKTIGNVSRKSKHFTKQSRFEGSNRQVRGRILKALVKHQKLTLIALVDEVDRKTEEVEKNLGILEKEGFIVKKKNQFVIRS